MPTRWSTFSRDWADEEELDELIDSLEAGRISHKQGLLRAQKLLLKFPSQLEIQNFIANRLWSLEMRDEATDAREKAYRQASALIAPGFKGQISWGEVDNRLCWSCALATKAVLNSFAARAQLQQGQPLWPELGDRLPEWASLMEQHEGLTYDGVEILPWERAGFQIKRV